MAFRNQLGAADRALAVRSLALVARNPSTAVRHKAGVGRSHRVPSLVVLEHRLGAYRIQLVVADLVVGQATERVVALATRLAELGPQGEAEPLRYRSA